MKSSNNFMDVPSCICTFGWKNWDALSGYEGSSSSRPSRLWKSHSFLTNNLLSAATCPYLHLQNAHL